jgi:SAM-dependent methyltransferase
MTNEKVDFDNYVKSYNELLRSSTGFFSQREAYFANYKVDVLRRQVHTKPQRLHEFGCGIGRNIPFLRAAFPGCVISGSDISAASIEVARSDNPGIDFFVDSADEPAGAFVGPYDVIFVAGVFHHIRVEERAKVMSALFERLAVDGKIMIFEHNPFNPLTRKIVSDCPYDRDAVLLRPSELQALIRSVGFEVIRSSYCLFVPPSFSGLLFLENLLGWLPLGGQYWVLAERE